MWSWTSPLCKGVARIHRFNCYMHVTFSAIISVNIRSGYFQTPIIRHPEFKYYFFHNKLCSKVQDSFLCTIEKLVSSLFLKVLVVALAFVWSEYIGGWCREMQTFELSYIRTCRQKLHVTSTLPPSPSSILFHPPTFPLFHPLGIFSL